MQHDGQTGKDGVAAAPENDDVAVAGHRAHDLVEHAYHRVAPFGLLGVEAFPEAGLLLVLAIEFRQTVLAKHRTDEGFVYQVITQRMGNLFGQQIAAATEFTGNGNDCHGIDSFSS